LREPLQTNVLYTGKVCRFFVIQIADHKPEFEREGKPVPKVAFLHSILQTVFLP
jgi:hypothetical protein